MVISSTISANSPFVFAASANCKALPSLDPVSIISVVKSSSRGYINSGVIPLSIAACLSLSVISSFPGGVGFSQSNPGCLSEILKGFSSNGSCLSEGRIQSSGYRCAGNAPFPNTSPVSGYL